MDIQEYENNLQEILEIDRINNKFMMQILMY